MKKSWTTMKEIIGARERQPELFLSLITEDGTIATANALMVKKLELSDIRSNSLNFLDLVHPINRGAFQETLQEVARNCSSLDIELYVRNGQYHPMKWQVTCMGGQPEKPRSYLCIGYLLLDEERTRRFNQLMGANAEILLEGLSGIVFQDHEGEMIAANQKAARIFNTSLETFYQLQNMRSLWNNQWEILGENGLPIAFDDTPFMKTVRTGKSHKETLYIRMGNGDWKYIFYDAHLVPPSVGETQPTVVSHLIDVTTERMLSARVRDQEAMIASFLHQTPHLSWVVDRQGNLISASNSFYKHFEIADRTRMSKKATDLIPSSVSLALYDHHLRVFETGSSLENTQQVRWADGANHTYYVHLFPIEHHSGGRLVGGQAILLPDKSKLEKELRETHERLLTLSQATSDAIWEWDMQSGQMFRNDTLMDMIGYQADTSKGLSWWLRRIHTEDRNRVSDTVKDATDHMLQSWQESYRFKCADGSYKYVQDRGFVVYENGLPVKMIGSLQDISALKELEDTLADERLQKQKEISETVIRVQEKERTRIGHELHDNVNQILSTVKLFIDRFNPSGKEQTEIKEKSSGYLVMAIEEIRKLSRELVVPQLKRDNLAQAIQTLIQDIQMAGMIKITFAHSSDMHSMSTGRSTTIFRIIQEQLKNILKHSKANTVQISLEVDELRALLKIDDNGKGFNPKQTQQGIGLSNIHERSLFYNGEVTIDSAPGKGCRLKVMIPLED